MTTLVLVEVEEGRAALVSRETLTFARGLGGEVHAVVIGPCTTDALPDAVVADCADQGVLVVHLADSAALSDGYAAAAWATVVGN